VKVLFGLFVFTIFFVSMSCSNKRSDIAMGKTYDEVEKILVKPDQITRGVNQLSDEE